uniref:Uncharacterized protein n=1 Tax=Anguilla anguilla TaxID=7936 RepID=A0A0E9VH22_ANGAN
MKHYVTVMSKLRENSNNNYFQVINILTD